MSTRVSEGGRSSEISQSRAFMDGSLTIRYDTRCYFNVRSKADISQLNLPHGNNDDSLPASLFNVSGQVKAHVVLTCTNGISLNHLPVIVASDRP